MRSRLIALLSLLPLLGLSACEGESPMSVGSSEEGDGEWFDPGPTGGGSIPDADKIPEDAIERCDEGCERLCPELADGFTCRVELQSGALDCQGAPVELHSLNPDGGMVLKIDMSAHAVLKIEMDLSDPEGWVFNLGDSSTNNGHAGDGATTSNDSEAQLVGRRLALFRSDYGANLRTLEIEGAVAEGADTASITVCDSAFAFTSSTLEVGVYDPAIFQIDGDEPDFERQTSNDRILWLGVEQVVTGGRVGDGVADLWLTFGA